ncbi:hypothetical protein ACGF5H_30075 [Micromonospora chalcea]
MDLADCVERVLELRTLDLATQPPPSPESAALRVVGHDFLALYLSATEEFDDTAQALEVLERFEQDCASLEEALSRLWGPAESVDLRPYMDLMVRGETVPEPERQHRECAAAPHFEIAAPLGTQFLEPLDQTGDVRPLHRHEPA